MTKEQLLARYEQETGVALCEEYRERFLAQPMESFLTKLNEYWDWSRCGGKVVIGGD